MKIIDILVKISNGEEVPKKIKYKSYILTYKKDVGDYKGYQGDYLFGRLFYGNETHKFINEEVEIIDDEPKKIENIDLLILDEDMDLKILIDYLRVNNKLTKNKLNEIIEKINNYDFCKECYKKIEK